MSERDWEQLKSEEIYQNFEFGQLPVLEMNGEYFAQTHSILRLLGKLYDFYPEDAEEAWEVDSWL